MTKQKTQEQTERKIFRAAVLTPYLLKSLEEMQGNHPEGYVKAQIERFGYDPNNLNGLRMLNAGNLDVRLETSTDHTLPDPAMADLVIHGSTEEAEQNTRELVQRNPGIIIARYSVFYGRPSEYTGNKPEDAGYALDIQKQVSNARALLTHEKTLNAILGRDENQIRVAIADLNSTLERPVIITPHLTKALSAGR